MSVPALAPISVPLTHMRVFAAAASDILPVNAVGTLTTAHAMHQPLVCLSNGLGGFVLDLPDSKCIAEHLNKSAAKIFTMSPIIS
jgi:hypothetical protein